MLSETVLNEMAAYIGTFANSVETLRAIPSVGNVELACLASRSVQGVVLSEWYELKACRPEEFTRFLSLLDDALALMESLPKCDDSDEQFHLDHAFESTSRRRQAFGLLWDLDDFDGAASLLMQSPVECVSQ